MFCPKCGKRLDESYQYCPKCGANLNANTSLSVSVTTKQYSGPDVSDRTILPAFLLCFFFGCLGIHRFYVGKIGTGIIWLLTLGVFGIGAFIDLILIIVGSFKDSDGKTLKNWT